MKKILLLLMMIQSLGSGQSLYSGRGRSATLLGVSYATAEGATVEAMTIGHSFKGIVDLALVGGLGQSKNGYSDILFWGPAFSLYVVNADSTGGGIVSVDLAYSSVSTTGFGSATVSTVSAGGTLGAKVLISDVFSFIPLLSGGVSSSSGGRQFTVFGFGSSLAFRLGKRTQFILTPSASISNSITTLGLDAGFVLMNK